MFSKCLSAPNLVRCIRFPRVKKTKMSGIRDLTSRFERLSLENSSYDGNETQVHGLMWEREIGSILGASIDEMNSISYTSHTDLPSRFNRKHGVDNHCKSTKSNTVCMGSAINTYDHLNEDQTHLTVIRYLQRDGWKVVQNIYQLDLTGMKEDFFGDITHEDLSALENIIKGIPPGPVSKAERFRIYNDMKRGLQNRSGLIQLNPKVDSKSQRRLQCSFKINDMLTNFPSRCVYLGDGNKFYDGYITPKIQSGPRRLKIRNHM